MNKIVSKCLSEGIKLLSDMHLKKARFTYSACETSNKNKTGIQKFR